MKKPTPQEIEAFAEGIDKFANIALRVAAGLRQISNLFRDDDEGIAVVNLDKSTLLMITKQSKKDDNTASDTKRSVPSRRVRRAR